MQVPADVLDKGAESNNDSTISNNSKSLFKSYFKEDRSKFKARKLDCKVQRASSALKPTVRCIDSSLHSYYTSRLREEDAEGLKSLGFKEALEDLILQFRYFLVTKKYKDSRFALTLLVYFSRVLRILINSLFFKRPLNYTTKLLALIYCS